jgi:hypothetical protein
MKEAVKHAATRPVDKLERLPRRSPYSGRVINPKTGKPIPPVLSTVILIPKKARPQIVSDLRSQALAARSDLPDPYFGELYTVLADALASGKRIVIE